MRRTRIVCTLGPSSAKPGVIRKMVAAGMDVARLHNLGWHHTTSLEQGIRKTWDLVQDTLATKA